jgi:cytosine/adenosine deaminase-related metal-dependent hydrolase
MTAATELTVGRLMADPAAGFGGAARIRLEGGRIAAVEPASLEPGDPAAGLVALPAPANAHDHGRGLRTLAVGAVDDLLELWIPALAKEPVVDPDLRAAVAFARMAEGGAGAVIHCHGPQRPDRMVEEAEAVSRAARDVGVRVAFAAPIMNRNATVYGDIDDLMARLTPEDAAEFQRGLRPFRSLEQSLELVDAIARFEHECFQVQFHPIAPQWADDETLRTVARLSEATGRRVHTHLLETRWQSEWADAAYPDGLVARLEDYGLLSPRLSVAHGAWLTPCDCRRLAARDVVLSVNPSSNLRLRSGLPQGDAYHAAGLPLAVGLDGMAFDDDEDLLREARLAWRLTRGLSDAEGLSRTGLFCALCAHGRRAVLGEDGGGVIAPGAPADLIVLDAAAMLPDDLGREIDLLDLLLTRMTKRHVKALIVGGREVVRDARCVSVDLPAMEAELNDQARRAAAETLVDEARLARLQAAVRDFYRAGAHRGGQPS